MNSYSKIKISQALRTMHCEENEIYTLASCQFDKASLTAYLDKPTLSRATNLEDVKSHEVTALRMHLSHLDHYIDSIVFEHYLANSDFTNSYDIALPLFRGQDQYINSHAFMSKLPQVLLYRVFLSRFLIAQAVAPELTHLGTISLYEPSEQKQSRIINPFLRAEETFHDARLTREMCFLRKEEAAALLGCKLETLEMWEGGTGVVPREAINFFQSSFKSALTDARGKITNSSTFHCHEIVNGIGGDGYIKSKPYQLLVNFLIDYRHGLNRATHYKPLKVSP